MALTRPKPSQLDTTITAFSDPITVLHQGASAANIDVGFLFNRANGLVSNVALYWSESTQSIVTAFTSNTGVTNANIVVSSYANLTVGSLLTVNGAGLVISSGSSINVNGSNGSAGQVLSSTGTGVQWSATGGFSGGIVPNQLVANSAATSTSTTTGALLVNGGLGVTGNVFVGGNFVYGVVPTLSSSSATASIGTAPMAIDTFATATYRGAKYLISTTDVTNSQYQITEIILTQDGANVGIGIYGVSYTGISARMTFTANINIGTLTLWGTGVSANSTVKLVRTLIPV